MIYIFTLLPIFIWGLSPHSSLGQLSPTRTPSASTSSLNIHEELVNACHDSDYNQINHLLSQGADINYVNEDGFTPLYWAVNKADKRCLKILLDHNVDVNQAVTPENTYLKNRGNKTNSPLFCALLSKDTKIIQMLLESGANPNDDYQEGWTSLTYAIWYSQYDAINLLLKFGADVNKASQMGTPLYLASFGSKSESHMQTSQHEELVRQLLLRGADPNNLNQQKVPFGFNMAENIHHGLGREILFHYSPLQIALGLREWNIAMLLIDFGADVTYKNVVGETGLHLMMQPLSQSFFKPQKSKFLDDRVTGILEGKKFTKVLETLIFKLTPTKDSCLVKNSFGQTPLHMAHLSQDKLLSLLKKRMNDLDIPENTHQSLGLDFLGRNALGECIRPNPLASHKLALFDKERLLGGHDLPEILDIVKNMNFWEAVESLQRTYPLWDTQAIYHSNLCHFMLNILQKQFKTHEEQSIPWVDYIQAYRDRQLSLQPFITSVIGCVENGSLPPCELQNLKTALASTPLDKREQALISCIKNHAIDTHFITDRIIHNQLEILPILFILSASSASLVLKQLHKSGSPLPLYHVVDKYQRLCYFALFQKVGLEWSQKQTPLFRKWMQDVKQEDQALSDASQTVSSFEDIFRGHLPIKTQGRCIFVEHNGRQIIMKLRYKHESPDRFIGSAVLNEGKKHDNTGLFKRCDNIQKVTLSEDFRAQCEQVIRENSEDMENVELSADASLFESESYFDYINDINDEELFWDAVKTNIEEYSDQIFKGRLFHRFLGLTHDIKRSVHYAIYLLFTNYYTHSLGSYHNSSSGVRWPNFGTKGSRDPDNTYNPQEGFSTLSFYLECLRHINMDPYDLFENIGPLSCLVELAGSMEILFLNWYRQRPHLLERLTAHEFADKMITNIYQVICEKLWNRSLHEQEIKTIKQAIFPLIEADFKTFQNNPDIIDSISMPFRARDFPLQNLALSRVYVIHLALACQDHIPPSSFPQSPPSSPQKTPHSPHERCYRYHQLMEEAINSKQTALIKDYLNILEQEKDKDIRFSLEEVLLDRLSSLKDHDAFIMASFKLMDEHAESIYYKALFCGCVEVLDKLDKHYQPLYPHPKGISHNMEYIFQSQNPAHIQYWFNKNKPFMHDPNLRRHILRMVIQSEDTGIWQEYLSYCQHHQLSAISFALDENESFLSSIATCYHLPLVEALLLQLQKEIPFESHLEISKIAELIYLNLLKPGDIVCSTHKLPFHKWTHSPVNIRKKQAYFLLQNPPNPSGLDYGLNFSDLMLTAITQRDKKLIEKILRFAETLYPTYSPYQLWNYILSPASPLHVNDHTSTQTLLWFSENYPDYGPLLDYYIDPEINQKLLLKLKAYVNHKLFLNNLPYVICNCTHFDDILFYKNYFDIPDEKWKEILQKSIQEFELSPGTLCILKHHNPFPPTHPPLKAKRSLFGLLKTPINHLAQVRPYMTPENRAQVDLAIAIRVGDIQGVENILKTHVPSADTLQACLSYAIDTHQNKLYTRLKQYLSSFDEELEEDPSITYGDLIEQCPKEDDINLCENSLLEHLHRINQFCGDKKSSITLLIQLIEWGWFSSHTSLNTYSHLYSIFFHDRLQPQDFFHPAHYLLYKNIGCFLENILSRPNQPYQKFPTHFFRPIASPKPLYLDNETCSSPSQLHLQKISPHLNSSHIYA